MNATSEKRRNLGTLGDFLFAKKMGSIILALTLIFSLFLFTGKSSSAGCAITIEQGTYECSINGSNTVLLDYKGVKYGNAARWERATLPVAGNETYPSQTRQNSEAELFLNLTLNSSSTSTKRAVYLLMGGGANQILVEYPDIILVAPVTRSGGFFGTMNLTVLDGFDKNHPKYEQYKYSNNLTKTDLLLALEWIKRNIAAFGGDPNNLTVSGFSANGVLPSSLLLIPGATDYYNKLIPESGAALDRISLSTWEESIIMGQRFMTFAKDCTVDENLKPNGLCKPTMTLEDALQLSSAEMSKLQAFATKGSIGAYPPGIQSKSFTTVIDNVLVFDNYWDQLIYSATKGGVKILTGSSNGEYDMDHAKSKYETPDHPITNEEWYAAILKDVITANYGKLDPARGGAENAPEIIQGYVDRTGTPGYERTMDQAYKDIRNDIHQKINPIIKGIAWDLLGANTYVYSYEWYVPNAAGNRATHGSHGTPLRPTNSNLNSAPANTNMGKAMRNAWASFILYGDPNVNNSYFASAGINWKPYSSAKKSIMVFNTDLSVANGQRPEDIESTIVLNAEYPKLMALKKQIVSATPEAFVKKLSGSTNDLTITVTERLRGEVINVYKETFNINNNAENTYTVGIYEVYVNMKGNVQIRDCYIVQ
jgi:carboxylesterase type B